VNFYMLKITDSDIYRMQDSTGVLTAKISNVLKKGMSGFMGDDIIILNGLLDDSLQGLRRLYNEPIILDILNAVKDGTILLVSLSLEYSIPKCMPFIKYAGQDKRAKMLVKKVGKNTMYGTLATELKTKSPDSPLKIRLTELARMISKIGYIGAILVSVAYLFSVIIIKNNFNIDLIMNTITNIPLLFGHILHALTLSVTIIVVAVPDDCSSKGLREKIRVNKLSLRKTVNYCFFVFFYLHSY